MLIDDRIPIIMYGKCKCDVRWECNTFVIQINEPDGFQSKMDVRCNQTEKRRQDICNVRLLIKVKKIAY